MSPNAFDAIVVPSSTAIPKNAALIPAKIYVQQNPIATQPSPPITDSSPKSPWLHSPSRQGTDSRLGPDDSTT
jgi:hypothetical protein